MGKRKRKNRGKGRLPLTIAPGFGEAIYELMILKRRPDRMAWGTKDLARELGVSVGAVRTWIGGKLPRAEKILPLAEELGVTANDLLRAHETGDISHISALRHASVLSPTKRDLVAEGLEIAKLGDDPSRAEKKVRKKKG